MMNNKIIGDFPPFDPSKLIKMIKSIFGIFKKTSEETGKLESINNNSTLEDIDRMTQICSAFKQHAHYKLIEVENSICDEINHYIEEFYFILEENEERINEYRIRTNLIKREIDKIVSRVKGTIDIELSKKISLDNSECKSIMKMIPGSKKETAMNSFLNAAVKQSLEECCKQIRSSLDEIYEDIETEVIGAIDIISVQSEKMIENLSLVDGENCEETAKKQLVQSYYLLDVISMIDDVLE